MMPSGLSLKLRTLHDSLVRPLRRDGAAQVETCAVAMFVSLGRMDDQTFLSSMLTYKVSLQFQTCSLHEVLVVSLVVDVDYF